MLGTESVFQGFVNAFETPIEKVIGHPGPNLSVYIFVPGHFVHRFSKRDLDAQGSPNCIVGIARTNFPQKYCCSNP